MFARSAVAVITLAAICGSVNAVSDCARNYTVALGDTCDGISAKENVSTWVLSLRFVSRPVRRPDSARPLPPPRSYQLATVNNGTIDADRSNLAAGEPLCLGLAGRDCAVTRVVVSGDRCESIAASTGTTFDLILANNPNVNSQCSNVYPGEVLCTAADIVVVDSTETA